MREILFRGICTETKQWVFGSKYNDFIISYLEVDKFLKESDLFQCNCVIRDVMPETIGQFTGLLDKNGVKIFENDIVRWDDETNGERWRVAIVEFDPDIQFRIIRIECDFIQSAKEGYIFKFGRFAYKDTHNH